MLVKSSSRLVDVAIRAAKKVMEEHLKLVPAPQVELTRLGYDTALRGAIAMALPGQDN